MISSSEIKEHIVQEGCIDVPYTWTVGVTGSRFLTELRDKRRIWGTRCNECKTVFLPPRKTCPMRLGEPLDWIEVSPVGTLQTFTVVRYADPAIHPANAPLIYGVIKLDGADTGLVHMLGEVELDDLSSGMRVEAVFDEERKGSILDVKYFRPLRR